MQPNPFGCVTRVTMSFSVSQSLGLSRHRNCLVQHFLIGAETVFSLALIFAGSWTGWLRVGLISRVCIPEPASLEEVSRDSTSIHAGYQVDEVSKGWLLSSQNHNDTLVDLNSVADSSLPRAAPTSDMEVWQPQHNPFVCLGRTES